MMRSLFAFIGACAVFVAMLIGVYSFYQKIMSSTAETAQLSAEISARDKKTSDVARVTDESVLVASARTSIQHYFVDPKNIVAFLEELQSLGTVAGASVSVASVSSPDDTSLSNLKLSLSVKGSFDAVLRTVGEIEYSPYDVSISNFSLVASKSGTASSTASVWNATMALLVGTTASTVQPTSFAE